MNLYFFKWLAFFLMVLDHVGAYLFPQFVILRIIGRFSFPLFAYFLSLGLVHTSNRIHYFVRLVGFACIGQIVLVSLFLKFSPGLNVLFLFAFSLFIFSVIDFVVSGSDRVSQVARFFFIVSAGLFAGYFNLDYGFYGVVLCASIYYRSFFLWFLAAILALSIPHQWVVFPFWWFLSDLDKLSSGPRSKHFYWLYSAHLVLIGLLL